ncbi:microvitellogenin-like [Spodoptera frugiperda]|uniref:Microvitellogenin-like n=1 Tax=Spodoptera frugiperda TaxID=7108 RepID=A0A9R0DK13_SPOFR|nr:microvitellogenin-like [Spodoptera frugiperda]
MPSATVWKFAERPNYVTHVDKAHPYSEVPYLGDYHLVQIPLGGSIPHVDYWGEGRVITDDGVRGFKNSYNVNHQYQLVSSGSDRDRKIPNRIPVKSFTDCDTSAYIKDNSVATVTVAGPNIHNSARDIARIVNADGKVIVFGVTGESPQIAELREELKKKGLFPTMNATLPTEFQGLTLYDSHVSFINVKLLIEDVYKNVVNGNFEAATEMSVAFVDSGYNELIKETVTRLIDAVPRNVMSYAYKLWHAGGESIVRNCFPTPFALIFNEDDVKIINKQYLQPLKLAASVDSYNDRLAWGDNICESDSKRLSWKILPFWENETVIFKIYSNEYNMYLKLDVNVDNIGDRKVWGSTNSNETRHQYYLEPCLRNGVIVFFIINRRYRQGFKLDVNADNIGDRLLWGHNGSVYNEYERFRWIISAF